MRMLASGEPDYREQAFRKEVEMPDPPNVKVYDRPEPKRPSPIVLVVILLVVVIGGYFLYRAFVHPAAPTQTGQTILLNRQVACQSVTMGTARSIGVDGHLENWHVTGINAMAAA